MANFTPTEVLDRLADDPNGWSSPVNRYQAHLIIALRNRRVDDEVIYDVLDDMGHRTDRR